MGCAPEDRGITVAPGQRQPLGTRYRGPVACENQPTTTTSFYPFLSKRTNKVSCLFEGLARGTADVVGVVGS